jgi:myo-inositol-1(or 4)-monophosphatase
MATHSSEVDVMIAAARKAGESLLSHFARLGELDVIEKNPSDFVSSADLRAQEVIRAALSSAYPDHQLVLEETHGEPIDAERPRFLVDPLDGTTNFLHGLPHFAVSIALAVGNRLIAGVVYDPSREEIFYGQEGAGAWLGRRRLAVSKEQDLARSVLGTGIPHRGTARHGPYVEALARVMPEVAGVRRLGAAALDLAYVAAGRFEGFFDMGLACWDFAAGALLVREAGGVVTREDGSELALDGDDVLASNGEKVHERTLDLLSPLHRAGRVR